MSGDIVHGHDLGNLSCCVILRMCRLPILQKIVTTPRVSAPYPPKFRLLDSCVPHPDYNIIILTL